MDVQCGGEALPEFTPGVVFAEIEVYTACDTDEDVVEQAVGFIGAAHDVVLGVAVAVFLGRGGSAEHGKECNQVEAFHV